MAEVARRTVFRCAIYTRKSSEEGLEQDFNSLHAQREAGVAYVSSQKHEGWRLLPAPYDDGGYSGGSLERPALQRLLAAVAAGEVDVVVVYKVDRLTRSLTDFAKIVEVFDRHGVAFVSVTQAFNTTTSMGRLTLNVLLSFAQFEREVTGERIRDKIAASKKKGLWMGGFVPIGYEAAGRTLTINEVEAETIRTIYDRYLDLKSVDALKVELDERRFRTKQRPGRSQQMSGGVPFSRGHLYRILSNPLYSGRIEHKGKAYDGQHPAIIDREKFAAVQTTLAANAHTRLVKAYSKQPSVLTGLLFEEGGERLVASHANKGGRRYRYYVSADDKRSRGKSPGSGAVPRTKWRLPAAEVEEAAVRLIVSALRDEAWLASHVFPDEASIATRQEVTARAQHLADQLAGNDAIPRRGVLLLVVESIVLGAANLTVAVRADSLREPRPERAEPNDLHPLRDAVVSISRPCSIRNRGTETQLVIEGGGAPEPEPDPVLVTAIAQAHRWWGDLLAGRFASLRDMAAAYGTHERYAAWIIRLAFLSPDLKRRVLDGSQPIDMTLHRLLNADELPMKWHDQR